MNGSKDAINRFSIHKNAFGFIRVLFASLVIVSHTPELLDGTRDRELLTRLVGTISFGELAVDGFFVVSGYLITGSYLNSRSNISYLIKRIARIYPAFIVSVLLCVFLVAPFAGASAKDILASLPKLLFNMMFLRAPEVPNVFRGTPYSELNGVLWTISREFACYLMILIFGLLGILRKPLIVMAVAILSMFIYEIHVLPGHNQHFKLGSLFLSGAIFYLWKDYVRYDPFYALASFIALILFMFNSYLVEPAFAVFGAYLIFYVAFSSSATVFGRINNRSDISYGLYLYAWPVEKLIIWYLPSVGPVVIGLLTFVIASFCGWISWHGLEKRVMRLSEKWNGPSSWERDFAANWRSVVCRMRSQRRAGGAQVGEVASATAPGAGLGSADGAYTATCEPKPPD